MKTLERLGAEDLTKVVTAFRDALRDHQGRIDQLNVYPVPDGDTGTNMALTVDSVVTEMAAAAPDMASVSKALSHGSLMGARGNSGVILAQILRGVADAAADSDFIEAAGLADALQRASAGAYGAVMRPVEGTILTVVAAAASAGMTAAMSAGSLLEVCEAARAGGATALAHTPELLEVLARAGVVDAGGSGLLLLFDALLHVVDGRPLPPCSTTGTEVVGPAVVAVGEDSAGARSIEEWRYEVMYLLECPDEAISAFRTVWAGIGDSIVVVGGSGLWNCHIHTNDIGAAVEAALDTGRPSRIRVTDLFEQVAEERWVREASRAPAPPEIDQDEPVVCAVVAVANGDGIRRIFRSLGVKAVVTGGQSMNPSTAALVQAIDSCAADQVVLLPNNSNVVPVARQAAELSGKTVEVVATRDVAEGFAALLEYDPQADAAANFAAMLASSKRVVAGEVTRAVRRSDSYVGPIEIGDYLGLSRRGIEVVGSSCCDAACRLLDALVESHHEVVTILEGEAATAAVTRNISEWLSEHRPGITSEVLRGGQPLYPYLFSIE